MSDCIFCRIANKEIPAQIIAEDASTVAFRDINPQAPIHVLIIPRLHVEKLSDISEKEAAIIGASFLMANKVASQLGIAKEGYRVVANCGEIACQSVWHLHFHLLGGRAMGWPPG
jgi:histidine triad (HIT) family protein